MMLLTSRRKVPVVVSYPSLYRMRVLGILGLVVEGFDFTNRAAMAGYFDIVDCELLFR